MRYTVIGAWHNDRPIVAGVIDVCLRKCTKSGLKYPTTVGGLWGILP